MTPSIADPSGIRRVRLIVAAATFLGAFVMYGGSLSAGWQFEVFCLRGDWTTVFAVGEGAGTRYSPLGNFLVSVVDDPHILRGFILLLFAGTAATLPLLVLDLGGSIAGAAAAALVFLSIPHHTESVLWLAGAIYYVPMGALATACCALFLSKRGERLIPAVLASVCGALAMLFHEQAVALGPALCALAYASGVRSMGELGRRAIPIVVTLSAGISLALLKIWVSTTQGTLLGIQDFAPADRARSVLESLTWGLAVPLAPGPLSLVGLAALLVLVGAGLRRPPWLAVSFVWLVTILPAALFSWPQARYFHLPSVWMSVWVGLAATPLLSGTTSGPVKRGLTVLALSLALVLNGHDFLRRQSDWLAAADEYDAAAVAVVADLSRRMPTPARRVALVDFPDELRTHRRIQAVSVFRGCFGFRVEHEARKRHLGSTQFELVRTAACRDCSADLPVASFVDADACFGFDRQARRITHLSCPGHGSRSSAPPPVEGRVALRASASAYNESSLNDLYSPYRAVDGRAATEWHLPDGAPGWILVSPRAPSTIQELWLLNAHNPGYADRAAQLLRVEAFAGETALPAFSWSFAQLDVEPAWRVFRWPEGQRITHVRFTITEWHGLSGGIAEIVMR